MRFKKLISLSLLFVFALFLPPTIFAQDEKFTSSYNVIYKVDPSGNTTVTQNILLTNETSNFYPSEYILNLSGQSIYNLHAFDRRGPIALSENRSGNNTQIIFKFNDTIAGIGKSLTWTLVYDTAQVAHQNGSIWEILIPPAQIDPTTKSYTVGVYVPESFGKALYTKPRPNLTGNNWQLTTGSNKGIALAFSPQDPRDPHQTYNFTLTYHLKNPNFTPQTNSIALPPDTNYQKIFIDSIIPKPQNVTQDADGNWLADYTMPGNATLDPVVTGSVVLSLYPQTSLVPESQLAKYLSPEPFWETLDPKIQSEAKQLKTPRQIYDFVTYLLHYDQARIQSDKGRLGAKVIITHPDSAICIEFTDLFIALARAAGIPAREVDGYGYTQDQIHQPLSYGRDVLHAWPEFYDQDNHRWQMIDPTWGNTTGGIDYFDTLDLDHIAFIIRGQSSTSPKPAGAYKIAQTGFGKVTPTKDLTIIPLANNRPVSQPQILVSLSNTVLYPPLPSWATLKIDNAGPTVSQAQNVELSSPLYVNPTRFFSPVIPPFGNATSKIFIQPSVITPHANAIIEVKIGSKQQKLPLAMQPLANYWPFILGGVGIGIVALLFKMARK